MTDDDRRAPSTLLSAAASLRSAWRDLARRAARSATFRIVAFAMGVRVFTAFMAFIVNVVFPLAQKQQFTVLDRTHLLWDTFARYDSGWYFGIARHGYDFVEGGRNNLAFFPVYPLLMRYVGLALGGGQQNLYLAGVIISWVAYVLAMVMLYRLGRTYLPRATAERAVVFASVFPFAFFYGVVYSEALVPAVHGDRVLRVPDEAVVARRGGRRAGLRHARQRHHGPARAGAARLAVRREGRRGAEEGARRGGARARRPGAVLRVRRHAQRLVFRVDLQHPAVELQHRAIAVQGFVFVISELVARPYEYITTHPTAPYDILNGLTGLVFILSLPFVGRRVGAAYVIHMALNLWLPLSSGVFEGVGRYCAVLFPFFFVMATVRPFILRKGLLVVSAALYMLCLALWVNLHPIF